MSVQEYDRLKIRLKWLNDLANNIDNEIELSALYREIDIIENKLRQYK